MPWAAAAVVGGSLISADASRHAANQQEDAAKAAADQQQKQNDQTRADYKPWLDAGKAVLPQLLSGVQPGGEFAHDFTLADFAKDPGYQFRMDEGMRGIESSAAAHGNLESGGTLKALTRYGQGFASNEFQNAYNRYNNNLTTRFNRLSGIAGTGQTATRDVAQFGDAGTARIGEQTMLGGASRASGYVGQANAYGGGLQSLGNWYQQRQLMGQQPSAPTMWPSPAGIVDGYGGGQSYNNPSAYVAPGG